MRITLQPYAERTELREDVFVRFVDHQGDDTLVATSGRAVLGKDARKYNRADYKLIRFMLRNGVEQPFRTVRCVWHIEVPHYMRREFQVLGEWIFDSKQGDPYAYAKGDPEHGIWMVNLWDLLQIIERWQQPRQPAVLKLCARHFYVVLRKWMPITWEAFNDYTLQGAQLSQQEIIFLRHMFEEMVFKDHPAGDLDVDHWWRSRCASANILGDEQDEFAEKMQIHLWGHRRRRRR